MILLEGHEGVARVHYAGKEIAQNILHIGLWFPTLHKDAKAFCKTYDVFQRIGKPSMRDEMLLVPQATLHDLINGSLILLK